MNARLRPFKATDHAACMRLFDGNTPSFFAPHERLEFEGHLNQNITPNTPYFVLEDLRGILACGGLAIEAERAWLAWGMVDNRLHKRGLGRSLLTGRLEWLRQNRPQVQELLLDTSQHSRGFYERLGFRVLTETKNGYTAGLDRFDMALQLRSPGPVAQQ